MKLCRHLQKIFTGIFPYTCVLCQNKSNQANDLCSGCEQDLPWLKQVCSCCSLPLPQPNICGACIKNPPSFATTLALFHYEFPINHLITQLKFHKKLLYARIFGTLMAKQIANYYQGKLKPQIIIPMPLHFQRLGERGYNQALELSRIISKKLNIPINFQTCKRIKATEPQANLPLKKRRSNVKNAFEINSDLRNKYILVIDDVMTTGYTMQAFCNSLKQKSAARIDVGCVARTSRK